MQPDQYAKLKAAYKASYAFRDKIDTDGFNHPRKIYDLPDALLRRGYSDSNIQAVLGGNNRRLLGESWTPQPQVEKKSCRPDYGPAEFPRARPSPSQFRPWRRIAAKNASVPFASKKSSLRRPNDPKASRTYPSRAPH